MTDSNIGRPSKYYPELCKIAEDFMSKGFTKMATCGELDICEDTLYRWCKEHPEFSEAIKRGEKKALLLHEKILNAKISGRDIEGFDSKKSDTSCLIFALKTRFHKIYGDKVEQNVEHNVAPLFEIVEHEQ